jgi:hypothetical protein
MSKQVVEYGGLPVGITVPEGDRLKFIAVKFPVIELDGKYYNDINELRRAIGRHLEGLKPEDQAEASVAADAVKLPPIRNAFNIA